MKKITLVSFACLSMALTNCSKDDVSEVVDEKKEQIIQEVENTKLDPDAVSKGISIEGSTKVEGNPPTPNGAVPFSLDFKKQDGYLNAGFDIEFAAPDNYGGAYIQLKSEDGTVADSYFNVESASGLKSAQKAHTVGRKNSVANKKKMYNQEIEIDFETGLQPGKFCYIICIYDTEGNISLPQEVCVTVKAWGGNSALVAKWNFVQNEKIENGVSEIVKIGEQDCSDANGYCDETQESFEIKNAYCDRTTSAYLDIKANGTYETRFVSDYKNYDFDASRAACEAVYEEEVLDATDISRGNWTYNAETNEFTIVEFYYSEEGDEDAYEDGYVSTFKLDLSGNSLVFSDTEEYEDSQGTIVNTFKQFFTK